jgi:tripartite-type tricarboxylate transporter receptor subunit TctC
MQGTASRGFGAPKDTPKERLDVIINALKKIVASDAYKAELRKR